MTTENDWAKVYDLLGIPRPEPQPQPSLTTAQPTSRLEILKMELDKVNKLIQKDQMAQQMIQEEASRPLFSEWQLQSTTPIYSAGMTNRQIVAIMQAACNDPTLYK